MPQTSDEADKLVKQIRRLINQTTPGRPPLTAAGERRLVSRYGRVLPVLVVPLRDHEPLLDEANFVISRDLSDRGICLIQNEEPQHLDVVIGLWYASQDTPTYANDPLFFMARVMSREPMGGDLWQVGVEFKNRYADSVYLRGLHILAKGLIPLPLLNAEDRALMTAVN